MLRDKVFAANASSPPVTINTICGWGGATCGRLGDGTTTNKSSPVSVIGGFTDWCQISTGCEFSLALRQNGTLWAWGYGYGGRLGNNTTVDKSSPVSVIGGFTDWCQVAAGLRSSFGLRTNGTLWAWGCGGNGALGNNCTTNRSSPVSVVGGFTDWCQVASSGTSNSICQWALAVRQNGTAWAWGWNSCGQLGTNDTTSCSSPVSVVGGFTDWCKLSAGRSHSMGLRQTGQLYAWGYNSSGQLGNNNTTTQLAPVPVTGGFTDWCNLSAGGVNSFAIRTNGTLWAWGESAVGQLGNNTGYGTNRSSPVSVVGGFTDWCQVSGGFRSTLAVRQNGTAWAWGCNNVGQSGDNTTVSKSSPVSVVGGFTDWCQVSAGGPQSLGLRCT